ncbi:MAG: type VI secretion system baseplate subunit TssE [Syntrophus sp. (in: bacteria)]|jgi:type VI secretion system lysozyme-like protein|nr:type VI secretion system baseplate subunit TssE [Syntrophus sp. (in: bacteria)]
MALFNKFRDRSVTGREDEIKDILDNLNHVLNTKKGYGSFLSDFGIRDMNQFSSRDQLATVIMEEVQHNIEQYEPRLQVVKISVEDHPDPFRISFKIECLVKNTQKELFMEFNSVHHDFHIKNS